MAQDINGKKTNLDDHASIYDKRDDNLSDRERLSKMSAKKKLSFFRTYYLPTIIVVIIVISVVGYIVGTDLFSKKNTYLRCAVLNETASDGDLEALGDSFTESLNMDPDINRASFYNYITDNEFAATIGANTNADKSELAGRIVSGTLTCIIAQPEDVSAYIDRGLISPLDDLLTEQKKNKMKDKLFLSKSASDKKEQIYGIKISESNVWKNTFTFTKQRLTEPVIFLMKQTDENDKKHVLSLIDYFFLQTTTNLPSST